MFTLPVLPSLIGNSLYVYKEPESLKPQLPTNLVGFEKQGSGELKLGT
jgi:hypothetical protein